VLDKPPHVSARCRAKSKRSGEQCKRWASIGFSTCRMHGGHAKSGRPTTNGNHTLEKKRQKRFVHIVRGLLNANAEKPLRVDPEPHTVDTTAEDNGDDKKH
jgi:hypothetical protein